MAQLQRLSIKGKDINKIIVDVVYPVGSFFITTDSKSPATLFEGTTWERIYGAFLWGAEDGEAIGPTINGKKTVALTIDEMPAHSHGFTGVNDNSTMTDSAGNYPIRMYPDKAANWNNGSGIAETGGSQPHNNMPPYYVTYIWHRTS